MNEARSFFAALRKILPSLPERTIDVEIVFGMTRRLKISVLYYPGEPTEFNEEPCLTTFEINPISSSSAEELDESKWTVNQSPNTDSNSG